MNRLKNIHNVIEATINQASAVAQAVSLGKNKLAKLTIIDVFPLLQTPGRYNDQPH